MNPPETNDPLDALLRDQNAYIEDNGFTARVIASLPRRHSPFLMRQTLLLGATAIGAALTVLWLPWENLPAFNWTALLSLNIQMLPWVLVFSVPGALVWAAVSAVQWDD
jgi:hypothetical protein